MPIYTMDMKIKLASGAELSGQNWLTINYPYNARWGICSSNAELTGLRGSFNYSEKLGFEGTTFYKDNTEREPDAQVIVFRLAIFRGGTIDYQSWQVGKGGKGHWVTKPKPEFARDFEWVIRTIDTSIDA
jgi:hypothetical protein